MVQILLKLKKEGDIERLMSRAWGYDDACDDIKIGKKTIAMIGIKWSVVRNGKTVVIKSSTLPEERVRSIFSDFIELGELK